MAIDNMYELESPGELLEKKSLITQQEILPLATDIKRKNPPADSTGLSAQRFIAMDSAVIEK